ncbi:MAG: GWxTD domain-containing protein [Bacteroidales bacterium]|nr:GWxTD domain-containing protein [Bacteroidales bacterium]
MKKSIFLIATCFLLFFNINNNIAAKNLKANLSYARFFNPSKGPYIETYLSVFGNSIVYTKNDNNKFQGSINIIMLFKQNDTIVKISKYNLNSPEITDTLNTNFNFIDQQRFLLPNGKYDVEIQISDNNSTNKPFKTLVKIDIDFPDDKISISDIELVNSYTKTKEENILSKNGFDIVPFIFNFYHEQKDTLLFYSEIYNTDKYFGNNEKFLIRYYIESFETQKQISSFVKYKRATSNPINILFNKIHIKELPSGNYNLVVEVKDKKNNLITSKKTFFQRSNPKVQFDINDISALSTKNTFADEYNNIDTLKECVKTLIPIATGNEKNFIYRVMDKTDLSTIKQFFLNFWLKRNSTNPKMAWLKYLTQVNTVNESFRTLVKKGYETDRGRVYLQYGPPNSITKRHHEPSAYPYEIWHYYNIDGQSNRKFVFVANDLVTNDFFIIHSNVIGEISNYRWNILIHRRTGDAKDIDQENIINYWGNKSRQYYDFPE